MTQPQCVGQRGSAVAGQGHVVPPGLADQCLWKLGPALLQGLGNSLSLGVAGTSRFL